VALGSRAPSWETTKRARRATRKFIESEPLFWPARYHLGELRREQGRIPEAVSEFKKVLEQDPRNSNHASLPGARLLGRRKPAKKPGKHSHGCGRRDAQKLPGAHGKSATPCSRGQGRPGAQGNGRGGAQNTPTCNPSAALDAAEAYAVPRRNRQGYRVAGPFHAQRRRPAPAWLRIDPLLANVRQHPRFKQILNSMEFRWQQRIALAKQQ